MKREYLSKEKEIGKLKTKKSLKIVILGEQDQPVQSTDRTEAVQVWRWRNMYLLKPGSRHHSIYTWK